MTYQYRPKRNKEYCVIAIALILSCDQVDDKHAFWFAHVNILFSGPVKRVFSTQTYMVQT